MSYSHTVVNGSSNKAANIDADIEVGHLVHLNDDGLATNKVGDANFAMPAIQKVLKDSDDAATYGLIGVRETYVETATNIKAGTPVSIGATGKGVKQAATGEFQIGIALAKPAGNGAFIPVLLNPVAKAANIY